MEGVRGECLPKTVHQTKLFKCEGNTKNLRQKNQGRNPGTTDF